MSMFAQQIHVIVDAERCPAYDVAVKVFLLSSLAPDFDTLNWPTVML